MLQRCAGWRRLARQLRTVKRNPAITAITATAFRGHATPDFVDTLQEESLVMADQSITDNDAMLASK